MNENNFLSFLQQLLTMADPADPVSRAMAKGALCSVVALAHSSGKADSRTLVIMHTAEIQFDRLLHCRDSFVGVPGQLEANEYKRRRLYNALTPGC